MSGSASSARRRGRRLAAAAVVLAAVIAADLFAAYWYYAHMSTAYAVAPAAGADAAVVLFSAYAPDGSLDDETRRRLAHAAALARAGAVRAILCSGGRRGERGGADVMARYLEARGVAPAIIHSESVSYDTQTNIERSLGAARARGWRSLVFVSSPVHLARVRHLSRQTGVRVVYSAYHAGTIEPDIGWREKLSQVHHEWIAWAAWALLPRAAYRRAITHWREALP